LNQLASYKGPEGPDQGNNKNMPNQSQLLNRERSILEFNKRVLAMAARASTPLLEQLRYICIVASNLDEFFEIRYPDIAAEDSEEQYHSDELDAICQEAQALVEAQYTLYNQAVMPALAAQKIIVLSHAERNEAQRAWVSNFFHREVKPLLTPIALDPAHPFPLVANKALNFIVSLSGNDAFGRTNPIAIVKVPRVVPRVLKLPASLSGGQQVFVLLTSVVRAHLHELFPGRKIERFSQFRVTRDSDLLVDERDVKNLRQALRQGLTQRHFGNATRLEVSKSCAPELSDFLLKQFGIDDRVLFRADGPVNLVRLNQLIDMADAPSLRFTPFEPAWPASLPIGLIGLEAKRSYFDVLRESDVMLHHPFESFDPVIELLREAVHDPQVLAIKMTVYRTGSDSALMDLLLQAAGRGKEVTVIVELKARFDEEANINWAEQLERVGAQVVYGVVGLKTHAKLLLITRKEGKSLKRFAHLSTGNYNSKTARLYTDIGFMTSDADITSDVDHIFQHLASQSRPPHLKQLWIAPFHLHRQLMTSIKSVADYARAHPGKKSARIVVKMNALTDLALIRALTDASRAGVRIDLIVRGACMLAPGVKGMSDNIRVFSVVGRFLEHTRIFYFAKGEKESLYLSSADWMGRNMFRRIEIAWPVTDTALRQRVIDECLVPYLHDHVDAWQLHSDGSYHLSTHAGHSAQAALLALYQQDTPSLDT
jgi:polyphosphate kinase